MARDDAPPFERGSSYFAAGPKDPIFADPLHYLGKEYVYEPNSEQSSLASGGSLDSSGRRVRVKVVQNKSGVALKPCRIAHYKAEDPYETKVDGYTFAVGDRPAGVIDEFLPAAGVAADDLFYIVVDGPTKFTQLSASSSILAIGDRVVPGTGTSATNDDAGRIAKQDLTGATATLGNNVQNVVGYAAVANNSIEDAKIAGIARLVSP
jgi:hypothetical protein